MGICDEVVAVFVSLVGTLEPDSAGHRDLPSSRALWVLAARDVGGAMIRWAGATACSGWLKPAPAVRCPSSY